MRKLISTLCVFSIVLGIAGGIVGQTNIKITNCHNQTTTFGIKLGTQLKPVTRNR